MLASTLFRILALLLLFSVVLTIRWLWRWYSLKRNQP